MKKTNLIIPGAAALVAIVATAGIAAMSFAASGDNSNASSANEKTPGMMRAMHNLTDEEKAEMETRRAEHETRMKAVDAAMASGDYNAWLTAVGDDCPMSEKINANNFPQLVKAHQLREEAKAIMTELGLDEEPGKGMMGRMGGQGRGHMGKGAGLANTTTSAE